MGFQKSFLITMLAVMAIFHIANGQSTTGNDNKEFHVSCTAISGNNLFAGTDNGVYLSTDGGEKWIPINNGLPKKNGIYKLVVSGTSIITQLSDYSWFISSNNGTNWVSLNIGLADTRITNIALFRNRLFAATKVGLFVSTDNGLNWTAIPEMAKEVTSLVTNDNYIHCILEVDHKGLKANEYHNCFSSSDGVKWQIAKGIEFSYYDKIEVAGNMIYAKKCSYGYDGPTCRAYRMWILSKNGKRWEKISLSPRANASNF